MRLNISINDSLIPINVTVDYVNNTNRTDAHTELSVVDQINLYGIIISSSIAVITNILVVTTFSVSWRFWRHSTAFLLLTLACVDIIGNGVCFIYHALFIQNLIGDYLPPTFFYLNNGFKRLSSLLMIPISANRYALTCRPFTHHVITSKKSTLIQITTLSVIAFSSGIFELHFLQISWFVNNMCDLIINVIMSAIVPLIITFILTILVIREFRRINRTLENSVRTGADSRQGEKNITRAMIAVNVAFIILVLPAYLLFAICLQVNVSCCYLITKLLFLLSDINFSINIFIYTLYLPKFRSTLLRLFQWKCCKKRNNDAAIAVV